MPGQTQTTVTTQEGAQRSIKEGSDEAIAGMGDALESIHYGPGPSWDSIQPILFGGYKNEVHSFMLGNINDYLNRWVSIQNDLHNGAVANLFKNVTLVGSWASSNRMACKFELLAAYLHPDDHANFVLFLEHFGHAVDEYSTQLVQDAGGAYNYTMVGDDALITNSVKASANAEILNQFRRGVRKFLKRALS